MEFTDAQLERYSRQMILPEIGGRGQERLQKAKILVIGAGGLGSPLLLYLAAAGIGTIGIIDADVAELSNLSRQIIFNEAMLGELKVVAAKHSLAQLNSQIQLVSYAEKITKENVVRLVSEYDLIADGCDNAETRFLVHEACFKQQKTLVSAAVRGFQGQLSVFKAYLGEPHPCYRCLYPALPQERENLCLREGVLGVTCGVLGTLQAHEAIREIVGFGQSLSGTLLQIDLRTLTFRKTKLLRDPECNTCKVR